MLSRTECLVAAHALDHWKGGKACGVLPDRAAVECASLPWDFDDCEAGARIVAENPSRVADG